MTKVSLLSKHFRHVGFIVFAGTIAVTANVSSASAETQERPAVYVADNNVNTEVTPTVVTVTETMGLSNCGQPETAGAACAPEIEHGRLQSMEFGGPR